MAVTWPRTLRRRHPSKGRSMTKDETLKLALETLESIQAVYPCETVGKRITAIKETLAQPAPVQEPLACIWEKNYGYKSLEWGGLEEEEIQEIGLKSYTPLYTHPPQRTWVGLTDEELSEIYNQTDWNVSVDWNYERAIEDKLKEKNT